MNDGIIRMDQVREGHQRTLSAKPGYSATGKKPFVAKGHDAILKRIQDNGGDIEIWCLDSEESILGRLVARDKYTITVAVQGGNTTVYKHAIKRFSAIYTTTQA